MKDKKSEDTQALALKPPADLSAESQAIWLCLVPSRLRSTSSLVLLREALTIRERAIAARAVVARDGMIVETLATKTKHTHPALPVAVIAEKSWAKIWSSLGLERSTLDRMLDGYWQKQSGVGLPQGEPNA